MDGRRRQPGFGGRAYELTDETPVYVISVAAQLSGLHPQTLRQYDRLGLVSPDRTAGRGRRYSARDIVLLREVQRLSQDEGINLAGIKRILELENHVAALRARLAELQSELAAAAAETARRYSARDIDLLRQVQQLSQDEGINLAGIKRIIELENQVLALQTRIAELTAAVDGAAAAMRQREAQVHASYRRDLVPVEPSAVLVWRPDQR